MIELNPKIEDMLKKNNSLTVMGLYWAGYWRFLVIAFLMWLAFFFDYSNF